MRLCFSSALLCLAFAATTIDRAGGAAAAAAAAAAAPSPTAATATTRTLSFKDAPFTGISICTPVALLVTETEEGADEAWTVTIDGPADAVAALDLARTSPGSGSLAIESGRPFAIPPSAPLRLQVRLPPRVLQYVERVHAPGDTWVTAEFAGEKAEIAVAAGSGVVLAERMGAGMAKLSLAGPGPAVLEGTGPWWEVHVTGGGAAWGAGATGSVRVKVDEGGRVSLDPAAGNVTVDGWVGRGGAGLSLSRGVCYVQDETDGADRGGEGKRYDCGAGRGGPASPPTLVPLWTCGLATSTPWRCGGGGGADGAPAFSTLPCTAGKVAQAMAPIK